MRTFVCLHVIKLTLCIALRVELLSRRAAVGRAFGSHELLRGGVLKLCKLCASTDEKKGSRAIVFTVLMGSCDRRGPFSSRP